MKHPEAPRLQINPTTDHLIHETIAHFCAERRSFFATDVSNAVKARGGRGRHAEMAPRIAEIAGAGQYQLTASLVPVLGGRAKAILYHPKSQRPEASSPSEYSQARRPVPAAEATPRPRSAGTRAAGILVDLS